MLILENDDGFSAKPYEFSIFRIAGGDLPPRDNVGARLDTMRFILDTEPEFEGVHKGWVLNAIPDLDYRREMAGLLHERNSYFVAMPMYRQGYECADSRHDKLLHAIPVNKARNTAIRHGRKIARFTVVLDGDCYFDSETWAAIRRFVKSDQRWNRHIKYYGVPHTRSNRQHVLKSTEPLGPLAEPMVMFRNDSEIMFDESIPFGEGDKLKLLFRLGYSRAYHENHKLVKEGVCKTVGYVHHLSTGEELAELDQQHRVRLRNESIDLLLKKLDSFVPDQRMPNEYWKLIQGWFDYQGCYSHFAFEARDGATFVEVGSWLGASACYLATEAKNRGKRMRIFAVDTWGGTPGDEQHERLKKDMQREGDTPFERFLRHMRRGGVDDFVTPIRKTSIQASLDFDDESLDFVFIDASHLFPDVMDDLNHWYPKVKRGGVIAGHDYVPGHPQSDIGVVKAVNEFFQCNGLEVNPSGRTWAHRKK